MSASKNLDTLAMWASSKKFIAMENDRESVTGAILSILSIVIKMSDVPVSPHQMYPVTH
jgi:hypothetical protein